MTTDFNKYLGDGLYADFDGWQVRLYASNGVSATNTVYLEPEVLVVFLHYIDHLKSTVAKETL